jgi:hypothetical protein
MRCSCPSTSAARRDFARADPHHDLDPTSPARDTGVPLPGGNAFMDQRTVLRPQGLGTDIGAVEYSPSSCAAFFADGFERGNTFAWSNVLD